MQKIHMINWCFAHGYNFYAINAVVVLLKRSIEARQMNIKCNINHIYSERKHFLFIMRGKKKDYIIVVRIKYMAHAPVVLPVQNE